jgi:dipeptidyl-peptidase-4
VSLPDHRNIRVFQTNADLKVKVSPILCGRTEFFLWTLAMAKLDGWLIKPSHFDESKKYPLILNVFGELPQRR